MKKVLFSLVLVALTFQGCYLTTVDSGEVGVQVSAGTVSDKPVTEGLAWTLMPLTTLDRYNVKAKLLEMSGENGNDTPEVINDGAVTIITDKGMPIPIDVTILYKLKDSCAPYIRKEFGKDVTWDNSIIVPNARDIVKDVIGKDSADIYALNQNREKYAALIKTGLENKANTALKNQCITVEMVSVKDIHIPKEFMDTIMKKNQMEEESRRTELQVKKARAEAEIEIARAEGTSKAQLALAKSITPEMIKWKELVNTSNAIQKWDGKLHTTNMSNAVPFVNVK